MKRILITLFLSAVLLVYTYGQENVSKIVDMLPADTCWMDTFENVCNKKDAVYYSLYLKDDTSSLIRVKVNYLSGDLYMTGTLTNINPIVRNGQYRWFYKNGQQKKQVIYRNNLVTDIKLWGRDGYPDYQAIRPVRTSDGKVIQEEAAFDKLASFPGGDISMMKYISTNRRYPAESMKNKVEGRVVVKFLIDQSGKVMNAVVIRKLDKACDAEALRVIRSMPDWSPAVYEGHSESMYCTIPIMFKLNATVDMFENYQDFSE